MGYAFPQIEKRSHILVSYVAPKYVHKFLFVTRLHTFTYYHVHKNQQRVELYEVRLIAKQ
jgi:hypothetical protein